MQRADTHIGVDISQEVMPGEIIDEQAESNSRVDVLTSTSTARSTEHTLSDKRAQSINRAMKAAVRCTTI